MKKKYYFTSSVIITLFQVLILISYSFTETNGSIQGKVIDETTGKGLSGVSVIVEQNGIQKGSTTSDFDGKFDIKSLLPSKYDVKASYIGYNNNKPFIIKDVLVKAGEITFVEEKLTQLAGRFNSRPRR